MFSKPTPFGWIKRLKQSEPQPETPPNVCDHPYKSLPAKAYWRAAVSDQSAAPTTDYVAPKWPITRKDFIATAGSCFAQHIGNRLKSKGYNVIDAEPAPEFLPESLHQKFGYGIYSGRYGNIYTPRQFLMLAKEAFGEIEPFTDVWRKGDRFVDPLRPTIDPEGYLSTEAVLLHRRTHLAKVKKLLQDAEILVFTLGLTETWEDTLTGHALPVCPGVSAGDFDPDRYKFRNFSFSEIYQDLVDLRTLLHRHGSESPVRLLLTVSPVPLTATASGQHVMVASTYSKSVLRAVAGQMVNDFDDVDYFPSYEIVSNPWTPEPRYEANMRSVSASAVDAVMETFMGIHDNGAVALVPEKSPKTEERAPLEEDPSMVVKCDEELLDAFGSNK
ncbi:MAG: GSCFA domain-containing protein [Paracoccaceae bacterium]|nr:GSCFA domain-containing protein [Paracoccaceae bacterium]